MGAVAQGPSRFGRSLHYACHFSVLQDLYNDYLDHTDQALLSQLPA